ncbi:dehydrogenase [Sporosarcina sp. P26b]|uniref:GMC family oxidoreductase n=1 Tax=Sporosarcina sp. P26b TaxID=2048253 RepID=UPI000C163869|nr:GMC family oxidoreductase [Sporosarcina sp. P26b]PIC96810.1 dehydrogenase [Sporosarcina sp. P26b]
MLHGNVEDQTYDYIVVGTGPAGSVVANKLSNDKRNSVLVVEAGSNDSNKRLVRDSKFAVPILLYQDFAPEFYIPGHGIPQRGAAGRTFPWTGGRLLGGGSSVNNQQYVRPSAAVMQSWERLMGPIWSPQEETRRFVELENYNGETTNPSARGTNGRLDIRQTQVNPTDMTEKLVTAISQATGYPEILDYNDPNTPIGPFTRYQLYQFPDGIRESADSAFLSSDIMDPDGHGVNGRKLQVSFRSTVTRVIFEQNRAIGIEYIKEGKCVRAFARKKIILSAGISSVPILMHSGIGNAQLLQKHGIPVVFDNPNVGMHYADHPAVEATFTTNLADHVSPENDPNSIFAGGGFLPNPTPGSNPERRGIQLFFQSGPDCTVTMGAILLQPASRGSAVIQDRDPLKVVLGDQGYLANAADLETFKYTFKVYFKGVAEKLAAIDPSYQLVSPSMDIINDDAKLEKFIKENLAAGFHPQSMNRMGPNPESGVVDAKGHVYGVENLVIADDTIIPFTVDGNTSAPSFLIGQTIAEQLLLDEH